MYAVYVDKNKASLTDIEDGLMNGILSTYMLMENNESLTKLEVGLMQ